MTKKKQDTAWNAVLKQLSIPPERHEKVLDDIAVVIQSEVDASYGKGWNAALSYVTRWALSAQVIERDTPRKKG